MYVPAPHRNSVGTTQVTAGVPMRITSTSYSSIEEAAKHLQPTSIQANVVVGRAQRVIMARGRVGPGRFVSTPYATKYYASGSRGEFTYVLKNGVLNSWQAHLLTPAFGAISGSGNLIASTVGDIDPNTTSSSVQALLNKAAVQNLKNRVQTQLVEKSLDQKMDLAESIATLPQTVGMVADFTMRVLAAHAAVKRRDIAGAFAALGLNPTPGRIRTWPKNSAKAWMTLQYGWLPMLNDIYDGVNLIAEGLKKPGQHFTVTRRGGTGLTLFAPYASTTGVVQKWDFSTKAYAKCEAKMRCRIDNPTMHLLAGLGLANPAALAWNLLPLSFVVDWMFPVGTMLNAFVAPLGLTFHDGYMTTVCYGRIEAQGTTPRSNPPSIVYFSNSADTWEELVTLDRIAFSTWPALVPFIRFPLTSPQRAVTTAALAAIKGAR